MANMAGVSSLARSLLDLVFPPRCVNGQSLSALLCERCGHATLALRTATAYDGAIRAAILAYKVRGARRIAEASSEMLAPAYQFEGLAADLVTHAPLCSARRRRRGYDQGRLQARATAVRLNLPVPPNTVKCVRATEPQTLLNGTDRRIQLIDDVTATGCTLDATAAALAGGLPATIIGLALSRPNGKATV
jgi:predicted amidophosphoribosyltransferase